MVEQPPEHKTTLENHLDNNNNLTVDDSGRHVLHDEEDLAGPGAGGGQEPVHDVRAEVHAQTHAGNEH